jgi:hypothetical protein
MLKCKGMGKVRNGLKVTGYADGGAATKKGGDVVFIQT